MTMIIPERRLNYDQTITRIVPGIDYPMMAKLLPWCMKLMGYDQWLPVLEAAIAETRLAETEPGSIPDGCCAVRCGLTDSLQAQSEKIRLTVFDADWNEVCTTWPDERLKSILCILKAGNYQMMLEVYDENEENFPAWLLTEDGWVYFGKDSPLPYGTLLAFEEGQEYELTRDGLT